MGIRPYGDHMDDGLVTVQFTIPSSNTNAANALAKLMGLIEIQVIHKRPLTGEHTHYTVVGKFPREVPDALISPEVDPQHLTHNQVENLAKSLGRKIVVVGATTGTDTHTVGLDAILNLKGYDGHKGLESYNCFEIHNLGAQVDNETLVEKANEHDADVVLVSQTVTQQDLHIANLKELLNEEENGFKRPPTFMAVGGPRISNEFARELGFDAGFGKGTLPEHVATAIVRAMLERRTDLVHATVSEAKKGSSLRAIDDLSGESTVINDAQVPRLLSPIPPRWHHF